jgi:tRNA threonylcarbamoyladenosine biosynthesis protein TsaB
MPLILNIDTALETASISLSEKGEIIMSVQNEQQKDHASWIHVAIRELLDTSRKNFKDLDAIAVSNGPGSYTGLRVGLSTAKGLCYAQNIPLITVGTLGTLTFSATLDSRLSNPDLLLCPMIDARRMEVYAAVYQSNMEVVMKPAVMILEPNSFEEILKWHKILFLGNGSEKFKNICKNSNAEFKNPALDPKALAALSYKNFIGNNFAGLAYTEPLYLKEFYSRQ